jgi:hypothetical protein
MKIPNIAQSPAAAGLDLSTEIIVVCMTYPDIAEYQGTRSALEAEGVIPADTKWPEAFDYLKWNDGKFEYFLRRERPNGIKGTRKQLMDVDWWMVRCDPLNAKNVNVRNVELKAKELADIIHNQSAKGFAEWKEQCNRKWEAEEDKKFQAFKALIPGVNHPWRQSSQARPSPQERGTITRSISITTITTPSAIYLSPLQRETHKASKDRLRWLGGNIGFDTPISIDVIDEHGAIFGLDLGGLLSRLDDFEGYLSNMSASDNLAACCFIAHESGQMTSSEKEAFEAFVREKISTIGHFEAAKRLVLGKETA